METPGFPAAFRAVRSHRTGRTTQEVEEWTDPEEAAKEVVDFGGIFVGPTKSKIIHGLPGYNLPTMNDVFLWYYCR